MVTSWKDTISKAKSEVDLANSDVYEKAYALLQTPTPENKNVAAELLLPLALNHAKKRHASFPRSDLADFEGAALDALSRVIDAELTNIEDPRHLRNFLFKSIKHSITDSVRKETRCRRAGAFPEDDGIGYSIPEPHQTTSLNPDDVKTLLETGRRVIPEGTRETFAIMVNDPSVPYEEIAALQGRSVENVWSDMKRIRIALNANPTATKWINDILEPSHEPETPSVRRF